MSSWVERRIGLRQAAIKHLRSKRLNVRIAGPDTDGVQRWQVSGGSEVDHDGLIELARNNGFKPEAVRP